MCLIRCDFYRYNIYLVVCIGYSILYTYICTLNEDDDDWWSEVSQQVWYCYALIFPKWWYNEA